MAALTSACFTVAITSRHITGKKRVIHGTLTLTNTSDTYSTGGIPLPTKDKFGFQRYMDSLEIFGLNAIANEYILRWDKTNHTLLMYEEEASAAGGPPPQCDTSEAPATRIWNFRAEGW